MRTERCSGSGGLYRYPRINKRLGIAIGPDPDEIAESCRQTGSRIVPSGATAANRLGLSTQVPAKPVYLTDGRSRQVRIGGIVFQVRHASPKELSAANRTSAMVFQALRHLGRTQSMSGRAAYGDPLGGPTAGASPGCPIHDGLDRGRRPKVARGTRRR